MWKCEEILKILLQALITLIHLCEQGLVMFRDGFWYTGHSVLLCRHRARPSCVRSPYCCIRRWRKLLMLYKSPNHSLNMKITTRAGWHQLRYTCQAWNIHNTLDLEVNYSWPIVTIIAINISITRDEVDTCVKSKKLSWVEIGQIL